MIKYSHGYYSFHTLFRLYGSALYKACFCAAISSALYIFYYYCLCLYVHENGTKLLDHPYPVAAVIGSVSMALSFQLNFSYNRWWEACTALHNMHAKWLDAGSTMAAFHLQSRIYDSVAPPSLGEHQDVHFDYLRKRENTERTSFITARDTLDSNEMKPTTAKGKLAKILRRKHKEERKHDSVTTQNIHDTSSSGLPFPNDYWTRSKSVKAMGTLSNGEQVQKKDDPTEKPSLFLQETAHLISLLSAVALSTLRYDAEGEEAPLTEFVPGKKWPSNNSDNDEELSQNGYRRNKVMMTVKFLFDVSRSSNEILEYNAARPFHVIGGISDKEAELLRNARGASAKVALVYFWVNEFITREHMHGSMGTVAPPIISRLMQFTSDGHMWYNSARKMAYVPFPFPHVQLTTAFVLIVIVVAPVLMLAKTHVYLGFALNFFTVAILAGLNEVAKELENPFTNVPNDLPLNLFQAHFNESLITMFAGYHPDSHWEVKENA
mmetsp:Transcript_19054/g.31280  ORF Transcript_19054/g.31280 Transcript_19054/m.31280 type:complete len:493 (+) Transcript_19054:82-1560(+)